MQLTAEELKVHNIALRQSTWVQTTADQGVLGSHRPSKAACELCLVVNAACYHMLPMQKDCFAQQRAALVIASKVINSDLSHQCVVCVISAAS